MQLRMAAASLLGSLAVLTTGSVGVAAAQSTDLGHSASPGLVSQPSAQDQTFMRQNAQTDLAEIMTGKLANQRGTTDGIRQAGQTIMSDHQQVLSKLQGLAQGLKISLPTSPNQMQQQQAQAEQSASGTAFDKTYLQNEIMGHQMSISHTQQEIQSGSDPQVVDFAKSYLPAAQKHLQLLEQLNGAGATNGTGTPNGVNAGSGGEAASSAVSPAVVAGLTGGGALLVLTSGGVLLARRRRA